MLINKKFIATAMVLALTCIAVPSTPGFAASGFKEKAAGDIVVRLRGLWVAPDEDASVSPIGGDVSVSNDFVPEIDFTYFVTDNIALELIAATTRHTVSHSTGVDLGSVRLLPPTLTLQYHPLPKARLSPYAGIGVNYTIFYDENSGAFSNIDYDNSFGFALQAGIDYAITGPWSVNLDVKKIFLGTDVKIQDGAVNAEVDLDPWIVGFGVGFRF